MTALVATIHDPFHPHLRREVRQVTRHRRVRALAPHTNKPYVAILNGAPLLRAGWNRRLRAGDTLAFVVLPQGERGSNPLAIVLMLAVSVFAPQLGALAYESMVGAANITSLGSMIAQGAAQMIGSALVNAIVPPPKPTTAQQMNALAAPSPTYNLQAQGNLARLDQAIPVQYGRLCVFPDFAATPYVEYAGNEQYLYSLLCLGQGEYAIEAVRIEDTPVANFAEIDYEVIPPGGSITKFPVNVATSVEVSGQELVGQRAGTYVQSGTTVTVNLTGHNLSIGKAVYLSYTSGAAASGAFVIDSVPTADSVTVTAAGSLTTSGNVTVQTYLGGFVANASGTSANVIGLDLVLPRGLYHVNTSTGDLEDVSLSVRVEGRPIDDMGTPTGAWTTLLNQTYTAKTTTPQRHSIRQALSGGRYEVRVARTDTKQTDTEYGHEILWGGLRAYLPETRYFGNVTLIALRMRASNNLSVQASRRINVICTRKLPIWNGSTWSTETATASIAWAIADACKNADYSVGLPDSRIDLAELLALDAVWSARGDEFNGRFDSALSFWEALGKIAVAGRAKPYMQGGVVRIARDGAATVPVALFSMRNMARGSFSVDYLMPTDDTADAVEVAYFDRNYWASRRVLAKLADSSALQPVKVDLFGVTDRGQAFREGVYHAASNRYRRRVIKFATEMDGFIPAFGDLIAIQHDMPAWGQFAEAVAWNSGTRTLTLSEAPTWGTGNHYIGLRKRDGSVDGPYLVAAGATALEVVMDTSPAITPYTGGDEERTHVVFGWAETWRQLAKVVAIRPRGLYRVEIEAINEDASVHTAETGQTAPAVQTSQLTTLYTAPAIANLTMRSSTSDNSKALLTWTPAPGADAYQIEMAAGVDPYDANLSWTRVGETAANNFAVTAIYGSKTLIRVRGIGLTAGAWVTLFFGSTADYMWVNDSAQMWNAVDTTLMWRY